MYKGKPNYSKRTLICGVGCFDANYSRNIDKKTKKVYSDWDNMIRRCYYPKSLKNRESYNGCKVCDEWLSFVNFRIWHDSNYIEGYHLDKDILVKGNKIYSPDTCCFVPQEINTLLISCKSHRGVLPIGVCVYGSRFQSYYWRKCNQVYLGVFDTPEEAFYAYKTAKEAYIKEVAQEYYDAGKITKRVYDALVNYKVEITD